MIDAIEWHTVRHFTMAKDFNFKYNLACIMVMLTCGQLSYGGFMRELVYILSKSESQICTREGSFSVEGLSFDNAEMPKLTSIAEEDIVDTLFTYGMLAKEHEEYWITFQQAYVKLNLSESSS
ncbi:Histone acetyltransferase ESA1 [Trichinella pseudospiralis]|uniref:Histone acetyltransferase ESA1 n=1 Tax=Trichinella pseudospiralis TaxID=6337 RepID=A0A0V1JLF5_TRIPS|nr:Histone acetyltransferase ESA1 [Trichinella pseudospiralis]